MLTDPGPLAMPGADFAAWLDNALASIRRPITPAPRDPIAAAATAVAAALRWRAATRAGQQLPHWLRTLAATPAGEELADPQHQRVRQAARRLHRSASKVVTR